MITIAMAGSESIETPYFWFVQAVDAQFDYYPAYSAMVYSLLPRWGGSHAKMLLFANNCLSTNRFTTNVPYVVLDVLREMETLEEVTVAESPQASQLLLKFVEARDEYQAAHPDKLLYEHNGAYRANLVQFLEELHQYERVADIFLNASEGMNWTSLRKRMRPAAYLAARLVASPVKFRSQLAEFDEALRQPWNAGKTQDDVEELINRYQKLKEQIPLEGDASAGFIRHVDTILDQLKSYSLGEWVRLPTIDGLPGWEPSWHVLDGDRIELSGRQGDAPQVCLRPLANFHPPLEIEATLEIDVPHRPYSKHVGIGWSREGVEYVHNDRPSTLTSFVIRVSRHNNARANQSNRLEFATILSGPNSPGGGYFLRSEGPHRLRVKLWTHSAEFRVDELTWMVVTMPDGLLPQGWLCFGESSPRGNQSTRLQDTGTMIWSDIRLRRMQLAPPPADSDPLDQQVDYWEKRRSLDPEDLIAWIRVCAVYYQQKRFDDAIRTANEILETAPKINGVHKWKALALLDRDQDYIASLREFELALEEPRDDPESLARSAEIRAAAPDDSLRNVQQAKATAELSIRVTARKHARSFAALATAHAELGDFEEAMKYHRAAMELATDSERNEWEPRQALYEAGQAFRLPSSKTPSLK